MTTDAPYQPPRGQRRPRERFGASKRPWASTLRASRDPDARERRDDGSGGASPERDDADVPPRGEGFRILFFRLSSVELGLLLFGALLAATALGILLGRRVQHLSSSLKEPFGILQGALLGLVGLMLAFGLSLAVSRYENRRANVVTEANAIGTAFLRAQTLPEPVRSRSLALLIHYTRTAIRVSEHIPGSREAQAAAAEEERIQRRLWGLAGEALAMEPTASAPRLYVESLNEMIDAETARIAALGNRVPTAVLVLEVLGAALALGLLAAYLALAGRGVFTVVVASALVAFLLLVTADLDRPTRGMIRVPDTVLTNQLESMSQPPAARAHGIVPNG